MPLRRLQTSQGWTASVLVASAAQRSGTLLSTLYFVRYVGNVQFAEIVPLMPIAPLVNAMVLVGQDQYVLRSLLQKLETRLGVRSTIKVQAVVIAATLLLGTPIAVGVALAFHLPFYCAAMSAGGGALLSLAQATSIAQIRTVRSGPRYVSCYAVFGVTAVVTRLVGHHLGISGPATWALGDALSGLLIVLVSLMVSPPRRHGGLDYRTRDGLGYGLPLLPNSVAQQILGNGDRWVFAGRVPAAQLAMYVSAYQVANIVNIMLSEVNRSRLHHYVLDRDVGRDDVERAERRLLLRIVAVSSLPVALASAVLSGLHFVSTFFIALGICFSFTSIAYYLPAANLFSMSMGRTRALAIASVAGAVANLIINFALVHSIGIWSGLIANFIGYALMYLMLERQKRNL
ncbi:MAG TPA: hypothetical protein VK701_05755 [Solirubrobacteraceae bacterium]|nr:hypothetical protein [Solirubrobacteraceae bacterium]